MLDEIHQDTRNSRLLAALDLICALSIRQSDTGRSMPIELNDQKSSASDPHANPLAWIAYLLQPKSFCLERLVARIDAEFVATHAGTVVAPSWPFV